MAKKQKGAKKLGRSKRNGQAARYKNERRDLQNKLRRLKRYVAMRGFTGPDVAAALQDTQRKLGIMPVTNSPWGTEIDYHTPDYTPKKAA